MSFIPGDGGLLIPGIESRGRSHGLLTSLTPVHLPDPHWQAGFQWESDCSVEASSTLPPCPDPVVEKSVDGGLLFCSASPFSVYGSYKCSTGGRPVSESIEIASNRLKRNKERGVERIFWTGISQAGPVNPSLQGGNDTCGIVPIDLTPAMSNPLTAIGAIGALESSLSECIPGGVGVLHMNYGVLASLASNFLAEKIDGRYYTPSGQLIIAGAGYPGTGPGNVAADPGESWIFATGNVAVYYSDIFMTPTKVDQAVDRSLNNVTFYAEQTFSVIWECCVFAVRISVC